jgi:RNA recognition motif-containing protein
MEDANAANEAIKELDQTSIDGRQLKVSEARPKPERSSGGGGGTSPFKTDGGYSKRKW